MAHDQVAAAIDPTRLNEEIGFDVARLAVTVVRQHSLGVGDKSDAEHAVGGIRIDDFIGCSQLDFLDDRFRETLAQVAAIAVGLNHGHMDGANVGTVQRTAADLVAGAAGEGKE